MGTLNYKLCILFVFLTLMVSNNAYADFSEVNGFVESDFSVKLSDDNTKKDLYNFFEQRVQLKSSYFFEGQGYLADKGTFVDFKSDFVLDEYFDFKTSAELRELNLSLNPYEFLDLKIGRQVLTWGTGDYLFINDMFPKDYVSFFLGRDEEYLKKPSDAIKFSFYPIWFNFDLVFIPLFEPNTHAKGDRLSLFDSFSGGYAGRQSERQLIEPSKSLSNAEYAFRLYKNISSKELALYLFRGFDKSPRSYKNEIKRQLYYQRVDVYGASMRGNVFSGIGNVEIGYMNSREDSKGTNRLVENSSIKAMCGYSKDLGGDLNVGAQYYYEQKLDYKNYINNKLNHDYFWDEIRQVVTFSLTKLFKSQTVRASLFTFYSITDKDVYFRPTMVYDINDKWKLSLGANIAIGEDYITEFSQMEKNKNIFMRIRYSF